MIIEKRISDNPITISKLSDYELLESTKALVSKERNLLTAILHHLREVERRKLFSELGYQSLFDYAVKELKYSEGQAGRRIQSMRVIKEFPIIEQKIETGELSLSNISQAQSFFTRAKKADVEIDAETKLEILEKLENLTTREGERLLLSFEGPQVLPKETERIISESHTEIRFVIDNEFKKQIEEFRSLLGIRGLDMNFSELTLEMAKISIEALKSKRFGKKRKTLTPAPESTSIFESPAEERINNEQLSNEFKDPQYLPQNLKFQVWERDKGQCQNCGTKMNLNYDHIKPVALGGKSISENLRLLCFHCNQRRNFKTFGIRRFSPTKSIAKDGPSV